jgi:glycosyltransferase involved in cell wall biosynthesis
MSANPQPGPVIAYVVNSLDHGGAESGLVALIRGGLFAQCQLTVIALVRGTGAIEGQLRDLGVRLEFVRDRARMRTQDLPVLFLRLRSLLEGIRPQVVIGSLPQANLLARLATWSRRDICFISFEHNTRLAKAIYEAGFRLTSARVDWVFADSAETLRHTVSDFYRKPPTLQSIVPLVSFPEAAPAAGGDASAAADFNIVNAARFTATKNQRALIEAVALAADPRVTLTLYGEGPLREECRALAVRLGIADRVRFPGFVQDWPSRPAGLFMLASRHEGLCIAVLEAMHAGIPVAAPLIGGLRDYMRPELFYQTAGIEPAELARAIQEVLRTRAQHAELASRARQMVAERFGTVAVRAAYAEINRRLRALCALPLPDGAALPRIDSPSAGRR